MWERKRTNSIDVYQHTRPHQNHLLTSSVGGLSKNGISASMGSLPKIFKVIRCSYSLCFYFQREEELLNNSPLKWLSVIQSKWYEESCCLLGPRCAQRHSPYILHYHSSWGRNWHTISTAYQLLQHCKSKNNSHYHMSNLCSSPPSFNNVLLHVHVPQVILGRTLYTCTCIP